MQAIIDANLLGEIKNCELAAVISSNPNAYALRRAEYANIPTYIIDKNIFPNRESFTEALINKLHDLDIELVVLAGFLYVLSERITKEYSNRIINIHPALIPAFCGDGYYGIHVHEKVLEYGAKVSGATAHFVTAQTDAGPIILQKAIDVLEDDTPETLQRRIMEQVEWKILPQAVSLFCEGRLEIRGHTVHIKEE